MELDSNAEMSIEELDHQRVGLPRLRQVWVLKKIVKKPFKADEFGLNIEILQAKMREHGGADIEVAGARDYLGRRELGQNLI